MPDQLTHPMRTFDWAFPYASQRMPITGAQRGRDVAASRRTGRTKHVVQRLV
jgi:hypothetical protein